MLRKVDGKILDFWWSGPDDRVWAYLATFVPLLGAAAGIANLL